MGFETTPFGNGGSNVTTNVSNHYGPFSTGKTVGVTDTDGFIREVSLDIDGEMVGNAAYPLMAPSIPAGAVIKEVFLVVNEAFSLGGTGPVIDVGTEGSEATNGVTITQAQAQAVGSYDVSAALSGTWAAGLAAATTVGLALNGTTPTVTSAGKARVVIRYMRA